MAPPTEGLLPHLRCTLRMRWDAPPPALGALLEQLASRPPRPGADEQLRYLREHDVPAHPEPGRAARYPAALSAVRASADAGEALTWGRLREVQGLVLGSPPPRFRRGPAFARGGAVTYAWFPDAEAMLRRKLEADAEDGLHPVLQAVRAYLDLIFFHPFPDGNARAARLWLEYFLRRAGLPSPPIADLLRLRKLPGDERRAWAFATLTAKGILRGAARAPLAPR